MMKESTHRHGCDLHVTRPVTLVMMVTPVSPLSKNSEETDRRWGKLHDEAQLLVVTVVTGITSRAGVAKELCRKYQPCFTGFENMENFKGTL